jgi:hypothetical protein
MKTCDTQNELSVCFIAYADILGYRERILKCNNDYDALKLELDNFKLKILEHQTLLTHMIEGSGGMVSFFSDSVYIHIPIPSETPESFDDGRPYIFSPIVDLAMYQFDLAIKDIFIRGGVSVNYGYLDSSIAFGPGLLDAVECEEAAEYPRICLTEWAMNPISYYIDNHWPGDDHIKNFIIHGDDGKYFINYLYTIIENIEETCDPIPDDGKEYPLYRNVPHLVDLMRRHKENIESNLEKKTNIKIYSKFVWLANYHNYFCKRHFKDLNDLIIPKYNENFYSITPKG